MGAGASLTPPGAACACRPFAFAPHDGSVRIGEIVMTITSNKPKSWFAFLAVAALGFLVFAPLAVLGLSTHGIGLFLTGLTGAGVAWIVAAFLALWLATRV